MRFLFTLHNFLPERLYGAETVCVQQMAALLRRGGDVALFYAGNRDVTADELETHGLTGLRLYRTGYLKTRAQIVLSVFKPWVSRRFRKCLADFKPDVVVFHHLVRLSMDLPVIARNHGVPAIYWLHDFYLICPSYSLMDTDDRMCALNDGTHCPACLMGKRFSRLPDMVSRIAGLVFFPLMTLRRKLLRKLLDAVDLFVSPTRFMVSEFERHGVGFESSRVVPNAAPVVSNPKKNRSRPVKFGYLGNVIPKKGIDVLAKAFRGELGESLVIRGFSDECQIEAFRRNHPDHRARLELFDMDKAGFFKNIDVLIVPSLWPENQPMVILEAFAFGVPVLCSRIGGMPELVRHGEQGFCFDPGDWKALRRYATYLAGYPDVVQRISRALPLCPSIEARTDQLLEAVETAQNRFRGPREVKA